MSPQQRKWARDWQRKRRAKVLAAARAKAASCPWRQGRFGVCGAALILGVDQSGRVTTRCPQCERREAGICRDCPRPVEGRRLSAIRCADCKRRASSKAQALYRERHRETVRERGAESKRRWRAEHPDESRRRAKAYRQAHPIAVLCRQRRWRKAHSEWLRQASRRWRRNRKRRLQAAA